MRLYEAISYDPLTTVFRHMNSFTDESILACLDSFSFLSSFKDFFFIALGGYIGLVATNYFHWLGVKHEVFSHLSLLTAFLHGKSSELKADPYPYYRILENKALNLLYHGHDEAYEVCHSIAEDMEGQFRRINGHFSNLNHVDDYVDVTQRKNQWLERVNMLTPNLVALFLPSKRSGDVMEGYLSKEKDYVERRRRTLREYEKRVLTVDEIADNVPA